ncbi:hypothetical protein [Actinocrinis sp.]|uniref:hypothetical protein n=1 Tax=Actinocrinis sp. TaxID=1920516 RepID=UPI002DDCA3D5|nr:hypothetical protein [Actinocrinis sp.]
MLERLNCTRGGLARRVVALGKQQGLKLSTDHVTVGNWCDKGVIPRPATVNLVVAVLSDLSSGRVTASMIGMDPGGSTGLGEALDYPAEVRVHRETTTRLAVEQVRFLL